MSVLLRIPERRAAVLAPLLRSQGANTSWRRGGIVSNGDAVAIARAIGRRVAWMDALTSARAPRSRAAAG